MLHPSDTRVGDANKRCHVLWPYSLLGLLTGPACVRPLQPLLLDPGLISSGASHV